MKPIKTLGILMALLSLTLVLAGMFPQPVGGQIALVGYPNPEGLEIRETNARTQESVTTRVDENGYYIVDWANHLYLVGDVIEITILACVDNPECTKKTTISDGAPSFIDFTISSTTPAGEKIIKEVEYRYVCADDSIKTKKEDCLPPVPVAPVEVVKEVETIKEVTKDVPVEVIKEILVERQVFVCADGTLVKEGTACPMDFWKKSLVAVTSLLAVLSAGLLALYYKNRKKYKWVPGFLKILEGKVQKAERLKAEGKEKQALKELQTVEKTANELVQKHLKG